MLADTIYALSSGAGRAAVAVVRISGPASRFGLETLCGALPPPRRAVVRPLRFAGTLIDQVLVLWFPGPASFSGEDMAEIHCHGGRAVVVGILSALSALGLRSAEAGEFTRRALANGRMTLPQVEGLADLIDAETAAQHRQAVAQASGLLNRSIEDWRNLLVRAMALVEAHLDFSDEGDVIDDDALASIAVALAPIAQALEAAIAQAPRGVRLREGLSVVLAGPVNAGKSTLLNTLAGRDVAIVTPIPGTTRDLVEVSLDLGGIPVTLVDTAGLRETSDPVECEGIRRALSRARTADLVLRLCPAGSAPEQLSVAGGSQWLVETKIDSAPDAAPIEGAHRVSAVTGLGVSELLAALTGWASDVAGGEPALATRERHIVRIKAAAEAVARARAGLHGDRLELVGEDLRAAARELESLLGVLDVEDVLDSVFSSFCIGK